MDDIIFTPTGDESVDRQVRRHAANGILTKIMNGVYVNLKKEPVEQILLRNWVKIVARLVPNGVVTDRTGVDAIPWRYKENGVASGDAHVFMSAPRTKDIIRLPGLVINIREGVGPVDGDIPYMGTHLAGPARQLLDNLVPSRAKSGPSRTIGQIGVEDHLDKICRMHGDKHLNHIRDKARDVADVIDREREFEILSEKISLFLGTKTGKLATHGGQARSSGYPYDPNCLHRLVTLARFLSERDTIGVSDSDTTFGAKTSASFIESYFSNYIEGTKFSIEEATDIVFEGRIPEGRPKDGHDVLGTYRQLVDMGDDGVPVDHAGFIDEIKERHRLLMASRPSVLPGTFKTQVNQAGDTVFVHPDLVEGTIKEGMSILSGLDNPFSRALFVHFMMSDIHPFNDGNGRLSRLMMTKELVANGLSRIIVPTVYRHDYIDALRSLSRRSDPYPFVKSMEVCQMVTRACSSQTAEDAIDAWARSYGFCEDTRHARLEMPDHGLEIETMNGVVAPKIYWESIGYTSSMKPF